MLKMLNFFLINNVKTNIAIALICLFSSVLYAQEDAHFSQYYGNPLYLNPALTGNKISPRLTLNYRNQYPSLSNSFITFSVSGDLFINPISSGVGLIVVSDAQAGGLLNTTFAKLLYSYNLQLNDNSVLTAGFEFGYLGRSVNINKLVFESDILNSGAATINKNDLRNVKTIDFSAGMLFGYKESAYFGIAVHHLAQPNISMFNSNNNPLALKITLHAGMLFGINKFSLEDNEKTSISPNILYQKQGDYHQLNTGFYVNLQPLIFGFWHRYCFKNSDAIVGLLAIQHKNYKIGYSYDYTISKLSNNKGGAHEISFAWLLKKI